MDLWTEWSFRPIILDSDVFHTTHYYKGLYKDPATYNLFFKGQETERPNIMCTCRGFCTGCLYERLEVDAETHPARRHCDVVDCAVCGYRDCGFDDFMHYCGESCPSCGFVETYPHPDSVRRTDADFSGYHEAKPCPPVQKKIDVHDQEQTSKQA